VRCPVCKDPMIIVEYQRIELDYCTKCLGVWFDAGELELLAEQLSLDEEALSSQEIWTLPDAKVAEKPRKCQMCGKKMRKVYVGAEPKVLLDICQNRHGIWFDSGEVSQVLSQLKSKGPATGKQGRMINFLGEVFKAK
jgi:Zn-finger nucleic acid-binding protein